MGVSLAHTPRCGICRTRLSVLERLTGCTCQTCARRFPVIPPWERGKSLSSLFKIRRSPSPDERGSQAERPRAPGPDVSPAWSGRSGTALVESAGVSSPTGSTGISDGEGSGLPATARSSLGNDLSPSGLDR